MNEKILAFFVSCIILLSVWVFVDHLGENLDDRRRELLSAVELPGSSAGVAYSVEGKYGKRSFSKVKRVVSYGNLLQIGIGNNTSEIQDLFYITDWNYSDGSVFVISNPDGSDDHVLLTGGRDIEKLTRDLKALLTPYERGGN